MMIYSVKLFVALLLAYISTISNCMGQSINHWEMLVLNDDTWQYSAGNNNIPFGWNNSSFDATQWQEGPGGIGYGDNDDNTIIQNTLSLFMRTEFDVLDIDNIEKILLHADYDDGFVAYLNGVEIARSNLGDSSTQPPYWASAKDHHEAELYQGGVPETYELLDQSLLINGNNVLAIQVHNSESTSSDLSSNFFLSAGIKDSSLEYRPTPDWFQRIFFQSTLPLIKIYTENNTEILDDPKITAHMGIINNGENLINTPEDPFTDYDGSIGIEIRGTSSQLFDKKSYSIETRNEDSSNNNVELLGLPEENDWILYGPYSDKSLLRNVFTYHLGRLTGQYAPRTKYCELFINDQYQGIYVLTETIKQDKNRVDIAKLTEEDNTGDDISGGYIIKVDRNPNNIPGKGWYSTFPDNKFFAYVEPQSDQITDSQKMYIQQYMYYFELAMNKNDYQETYSDLLDLDSWVDYFLVTEISKHIDAYKLSFYMYKDKESNGGKLHMGPLWDINLGYGNFDFECSPQPEGWAYEFPDCGSWHPFWARKIVDVPNLQHLTNCRWQELREGPFQTDQLLRFIDDQAEELGNAIDRNYDRWPILGTYVWPNNFIGEDYEAEIDFFKNWLIDRLDWMDENMVGDCDQLVNLNEIEEHSSVMVYPNPVVNNLNLKGLGNTEEKVTIVISDIKGSILKKTEASKNSMNIIVEELSRGYYHLLIKEPNKPTIRLSFVK